MSAMEQIKKHGNFKRMMLFGLRSLSDLCVPPNLKYKENSLAAYEQDVLPVLTNLVKTDSSDEDVGSVSARIFYGMTEALLDSGDKKAGAQLTELGVGDAVLVIMKTTRDDACKEFTLKVITNLSKLGVTLKTKDLIMALLTTLERKPPKKLRSLLMSALAVTVQSEETAPDMLVECRGVEKMLAFCSQLQPNDKESPPLVEVSFRIIEAAAETGLCSPDNLSSVIKILDSYRSKRTITEKGSTIIAMMLGPEQLKLRLDALSHAPEGSPEKTKALVMLASMSYIDSYADAIVKAGSLPLLCTAISKSADSALKVKAAADGLTGACKMLGAIIANPQRFQAVTDAHGVEAVIGALKTVKSDIAVAESCFYALAPMAHYPKLAEQLMAEGVIKIVLESMEKSCKTNHSLLTQGSVIVANTAAVSDLATALLKTDATRIIALSLMALPESPELRENCINILSCLASAVELAQVMKSAGALKAITKAVECDPMDERTAETASKCFATLSKKSDADVALVDDTVVDCVLSMMFEHPQNCVVLESCVAALGEIATEKDVAKSLADLNKSVNGAHSTPSTALKALAAVAGLSRVTRLRMSFEEKKAVDTVLAALTAWITAKPFNMQDEMIRKAAMTVQGLTTASTAGHSGVFGRLMALSADSAMKQILQNQEPADNNVLDLLSTAASVASLNRIKKEEDIASATEAVLRTMKKYPEYRLIQVRCLNILHALSSTPGATKALAQTGALKVVLSYLQRVAMYEDVQEAGFMLLSSCLAQDPQLADVLKKNKAVEIMNTAMRTHVGSKNLQQYCSQVESVLVADADHEKDILEDLRAIQAATSSRNISAAVKALGSLNALTVSKGGARCAVRHNVIGSLGDVITMLEAAAGEKSTNNAELAAAGLVEVSAILRNTAQNRVGCNAIIKGDGANQLCRVLDQLKKQPETKEKQNAMVNIAVTTRSVLVSDRHRMSELAVSSGLAARINALFQAYNKDKRVAEPLSSAMAAMRHPKLITMPMYQEYLGNVVDGINSEDKETALQSITIVKELSADGNPEVLAVLMNKGVLANLFQAINHYAEEDQELTQQAQLCAEALTRHANENVLTKAVNSIGGPAVLIAVTKRALRGNRQNVEACTASISTLNRCVGKKDRAVLRESGIVADIQAIIMQNSEDAELVKQFGEFLGLMGADEIIDSLMAQIIQTVSMKSSSRDYKLQSLCHSLDAHLAAEIDDPKHAFKRISELLAALKEALQQRPSPGVTAAVTGVIRRLVNKFQGNDDSTAEKGMKTIAESKVINEISRVLDQEPLDAQNAVVRSIVRNGFGTMARCLQSPAARSDAFLAVKQHRLVQKAEGILDLYADDKNTTAILLDFFAQVSSTKEGAALLVTTPSVMLPGQTLGQYLATMIPQILLNHENSPQLAESAMALVSAMMTNCDANSPFTLQHLRDLEGTMCRTPGDFAAYLKAQRMTLGSASEEELIAVLTRSIDQWKQFIENPALTEQQKSSLSTALAQLMGAYADNNLTNVVLKAGGVEALTRMLEEHKDDENVLHEIFTTIEKLGVSDPNVSSKLMRHMIPSLIDHAQDGMLQNPETAERLLELLTRLCEHEGNARLLLNTPGFKELQENLAIVAGHVSPGADRSHMKDTMAKFLNQIDNEQPKAITLEKIYQTWMERLAAGESMLLEEADLVAQQLDIVASYTEEYGRYTVHASPDDPLAQEFHFGCLCYDLLHQSPQNTPFCLETQEASIFMESIRRQRHETIVQWAVEVATKACRYPKAADAFGKISDAPLIVADCLARGKKAGSKSTAELEGILILRLQLVEQLATRRTYFNNTTCMTTLIELWNDVDKGKFTSVLLRQCLRAMRQIINDHFIPLVVKHEVPRRLVALINNKTPDFELLPDVLFLLGTLATVSEIKTMIGDLKGVESCLDLLRRCTKANARDNTSRTQTNCCLALANLVIGHGPNIAKFTAGKGQELNIAIMQNSMDRTREYDVANGASILMCNTCFKRDDQKELYGKKGAPAAIMHTIKKYDGSADPSALRCITSMFKAIGNLALHAPNITEFLNGHIEDALTALYARPEHLTDTLLETSLRTVSNLVMENTEDGMVRFGKLVVPVLNLLQMNRDRSASMLAMSFEVLGCLCRLPKNARLFAEYHGIETVIHILNNECDEALYGNGIFVLGMQTTHPTSIHTLVEHGVFTFLVSLFDQQVNKSGDEVDDDISTVSDAGGGPSSPPSRVDTDGSLEKQQQRGYMSTEIVVAGLRCVRRLFFNQSAAEAFLSAGGIESLLSIMSKIYDHAMIHLEAYRVLLALLSLFPPPDPPAAAPQASRTGGGGGGGEWDADVADEGVLPAGDRLERPLGPRAWERIGLTPAHIRDAIIPHICTVLTLEQNQKQLRLVRFGLGLLAYFACEKVQPDSAEAFYSSSIQNVISQTTHIFEGENDIVYMACYIINNVAVCSDDKMFAFLRKDKQLRVHLDLATKNIPKTRQSMKDFCLLTSKLLNEKPADPKRFLTHQQWTFPLELTQWNRDAFPNGVQDLPMDMRDEIRSGGKMRIILDERTRDTFYWKASNDMLSLCWRIDPKDGPPTVTVPVSRVKTIAKGFASAQFERLAKLSSGTSKLNEASCCLLSIAPNPALPEGAELKLICGGRKSRDHFVSVLTDWREAATYGF